MTFITKPEKPEVLQRFYDRIQPQGSWKPVRISMNLPERKSTVPYLVLSWFSAVMMTYSLLFLIGSIIFGNYQNAVILFATALTGFFLMRLGMKRSELS